MTAMKEQHKNRCLFCSLGCGYIIETEGGEAVNLEYDTNDPVGCGSLCSKGNYILELINHPMRLIEPRVGGRAVPWKDALDVVAEKLTPYAGTQSVGLILDGDASTEDVMTARFFAEKCLGNDRVAVHFATGDDLVFRALSTVSLPNRTATRSDIEKSSCIVAVGDPFETGPVIAGGMLTAKYAGRRNMLAVISDGRNRTTRFARVHVDGPLRRKLAELLRAVADMKERGPSWLDAVRESVPVSGDASVAQVAKAFVESPSAVLVVETQDPSSARLAAAVAAAAGEDKLILPLYSYGNVGGICDVLGGIDSVSSMLDAADAGDMKALVVLGADIIKGMPGKDAGAILGRLDFLAAGAPFPGRTTALADPVLPTALWMESEGTYNGGLLAPVIEPPGGALPYGEILRRLTAKMGYEIPPVSREPSIERSEIDREMILELADNAREKAPEPPVRSSVLRFADGALTDHMSWTQLQEREPW